MDIETIKYTAEDMLISNLCLKWYLETDEEQKKIIFNEIQILYTKLRQENQIKI